MPRSHSVASQPIWSISGIPPQKCNFIISTQDYLMLGMVCLREVRHSKYAYTAHWQFGDSPSSYSDMRSVSSSMTEYICLSTCLSVCLWACLFVYQQGMLPLASDLYKLRHCLGLKHYFFRDIPKSEQSKLVNTKKICGGDFRWWVCLASVPMALSMSKTLFACMSVCHKPTILFS